MLASVEDFFEGGHSICRNSALHKMFEMIGGGERAASGFIEKVGTGRATAYVKK